MSATNATWRWPTCCWSSRATARVGRSPLARQRRRLRRHRAGRLPGHACTSPASASKRAAVTIVAGRPHQFRLLADGLLGYAWPKWVRAGEQSEFRVHSVEPYKLDLWRYGWKRSSPRRSAGSTSTARGPRCRSRPTATTRRPACSGTRSATAAGSITAVRRRARAQRAVLLSRQHRQRAVLRLSLDRRAGQAARRRSPCWLRTSPGTPTTTSAAAATTSTPTTCRRRPPSTRGWS